MSGWAVVESGWEAVYGTSLADELLGRRRSWRWFRVRLTGLVARDTPTATLLTAPGQGRTGWTPDQVSGQLDSWST